MSERLLGSLLLVFVVAQDHSGSPQFRLSGIDFEVTRTLTADREVEITVSGGGEMIPLSIRIGGRDRLRVGRAANVVWGLSDPSKIRILTEGRAVAAFREHIGEHERGLIAGASNGSADPHAFGFLLAGALVSGLSGDPAAGGRARDLIINRLVGQLRKDSACAAEWERHLLKIDAERSACLVIANGRGGWVERSAERLFCEAEFTAGFTAGETGFVACGATRQSAGNRGGGVVRF